MSAAWTQNHGLVQSHQSLRELHSVFSAFARCWWWQLFLPLCTFKWGEKKGSNTRLLRGAQLLWCRPKLTKIHVVRKEEKGKLMKGREAKHEFQLAFAGNCFQRSIRFNSGVYPTWLSTKTNPTQAICALFSLISACQTGINIIPSVVFLFLFVCLFFGGGVQLNQTSLCVSVKQPSRIYSSRLEPKGGIH